MQRTAAHLLLNLLAAAAVYQGWRLFWFLTDDAFIAFRYVSNSLAGHGLVWNPPPFRPVEGYTSFLWVRLLEIVWRLFGVEPPRSANWLALFFGYVTLALTWLLLRRMQLPPALDRRRCELWLLVLLGIVSNRTFLAWLSSGLETSLFNCCLLWWLYCALTPAADRGPRWLFGLASSTTALALTRPDGLLFAAATALLAALHVARDRNLGWRTLRRLGWAFPLLAIAVHLGWRRLTYGEWLPNTYYAKYVDPWPSSGLVYLTSFVLEYGVWVWLLLAAAWGWRTVAGKVFRESPGEPGPGTQEFLNRAVALGALAAHLAYYILIIGGDHFEYRVLSHLVPLFFLSAVWLAARVSPRPAAVALALAVFIGASWPLPWLHWSETRDLATRRETAGPARPIAHLFPAKLRAPAALWDETQGYLNVHFVCRRHQIHKVFWQTQVSRWPTREQGSRVTWSERVILPLSSVGVPGWVLPEVAIIDTLGLNDWVIARSEAQKQSHRFMAHARTAPPGYVECFRPNASFTDGRLRFDPEIEVLTDEEIRACESRRW